MIQAYMHEWVTAQDNYIHAFWQQSHNRFGGQLGIKAEGRCAGESSLMQFNITVFGLKVLQIFGRAETPLVGVEIPPHTFE